MMPMIYTISCIPLHKDMLIPRSSINGYLAYNNNDSFNSIYNSMGCVFFCVIYLRTGQTGAQSERLRRALA